MTQLDRSTPPPVKDFENLVLPKARYMTLDNGLRLCVVDQGDAQVCRLNCIFTGGIAESRSQILPSLATSLIQEGTRRRSGEDVADIFEFNGARVGTTCDSHFTGLSLHTLNSKAGKVFDLLKEVILEPVFPGKALDVLKMKAVQQIELQNHKVEFKAAEAITRIEMGKDHPLAQRDTVESVEVLKPEDISAWWSREVTAAGGVMPQSAKLYVAGRITPAIEDAVNRTFGSVPLDACAGRKLDIRPFTSLKGVRENITVDGALQSAVRIYSPAIDRKNPDYIKLRLLIMGLGGYFGSRLMNNIREDKGYTYGIQSYLLGHPEGGIIAIASSTDNSTVEPLIEETFKELRGLVEHPFTAGEVNRLKQYAMSALASTLDSPFDIMDYYINRDVAFIDDGYFERQMLEIKNLTPESLQEIAAKYIVPDSFSTVVAGA